MECILLPSVDCFVRGQIGIEGGDMNQGWEYSVVRWSQHDIRLTLLPPGTTIAIEIPIPCQGIQALLHELLHPALSEGRFLSLGEAHLRHDPSGYVLVDPSIQLEVQLPLDLQPLIRQLRSVLKP